MVERTIYLKKSKSGLLHSRHPWVFDGAVDVERSGAVDAQVAHLLTSDGRFAAVGTYNPRSAIAFRVLDKSMVEVNEELFAGRLASAKDLRDAVIGSDTDGFRLVNSEGDRIPGLTVDGYAGHLAVQVGTPAMDALSPVWLKALRRVIRPLSIVRKDSQSVANRERMTSVSSVLLGEPPETILFREAGVELEAAVLPGQKTGYYFDQRDNRARVAVLAKGKRLLDGYAYTGGFGAHALAAGAAFATGVETSKPACEMMSANYRRQPGSDGRFEVISVDCVRFLKETDRTFDIVVLDPPALAKRRHHLENATRLYKEIFESGIRRIAGEGGFVLACSCSSALDRQAFLEILRQAASAASREADVVNISGAGADHPVSVHHPEGEYLKTVLMRIV